MDSNKDETTEFWGGPRWRRVLVALVGFLLLGAWMAWTSSWDDAEGTVVRQRTTQAWGGGLQYGS